MGLQRLHDKAARFPVSGRDDLFEKMEKTYSDLSSGVSGFHSAKMTVANGFLYIQLTLEGFRPHWFTQLVDVVTRNEVTAS